MTTLGVAGYYDTIKPLINYGADYVAELVLSIPPIDGNVSAVSDGDTLTVMLSEQGDIKVRLYGVDAPELSQNYGPQARDTLTKLVYGKIVEVKVINTDRYGRSVAVVMADGVNINEQMLSKGMAWYYPQYCKKSFCKSWQELETTAKTQKIGLWKQKKPMAPWLYRNEK